jgi:hypothetical protein
MPWRLLWRSVVECREWGEGMRVAATCECSAGPLHRWTACTWLQNGTPVHRRCLAIPAAQPLWYGMSIPMGSVWGARVMLDPARPCANSCECTAWFGGWFAIVGPPQTT